MKANRPLQARVAPDIIDKIRDHSRGLVEEAEMLTKELVAISMPWNVIWYEAIEKLSNMDRQLNQKSTIRDFKEQILTAFRDIFFDLGFRNSPFVYKIY